MAVDSCLSTQKVRLPQNGSDFGGNPLAFNCAYELGSLLLHTGSGLIKSWSLKAKLAIWTDTTCDALSNIYIYIYILFVTINTVFILHLVFTHRLNHNYFLCWNFVSFGLMSK